MIARPKVVVLGMMTKMPVAGVVWQTMHYVVGFERLGYETYYVEAHARTPSMLMTHEGDDATALAADFIDRTMRDFDLAGRWAYHALHADGRVLGMSDTELLRLYGEAEVVINLHGGTEPLEEHAASGRLVYLETDPVQLQLELAENYQFALDFLEPHVAFFTYGENYGRSSCLLPKSDHFEFLPTRQPVLIDMWEGVVPPQGGSFTTIGNWHQAWRDVSYRGQPYSWSKHEQFLKFLDLPQRVEQALELALSSYEPGDKELLLSYGWSVREAMALSADPYPYRDYIQGSRGEFTVAKQQNVHFRSGWFSDRSATYLAAGRPVVTQDTGFGEVLPVGEGLFPFSTLEDAVAAIDEINTDYNRHARAAAALARDYFGYDCVLGRLIGDIGAARAAGRRGRPASATTSDPAGGEATALGYGAAVRRMVEAIVELVPPDEIVTVVNRGDPALIAFDGRVGWHFPRTTEGDYIGHHPADDAAAIEQLEAAIAAGAGYLVFPATELWWLDHYTELRAKLQQQAHVVAEEAGIFRLFRLVPEGRCSLNGAKHREIVDLVQLLLPAGSCLGVVGGEHAMIGLDIEGFSVLPIDGTDLQGVDYVVVPNPGRAIDGDLDVALRASGRLVLDQGNICAIYGLHR